MDTIMGARVTEYLTATFTEVEGGALYAYLMCKGEEVTRTECLATRKGRRTAVEQFFKPRGYLTVNRISDLYILLNELPTYKHCMMMFRAVVFEDFSVRL